MHVVTPCATSLVCSVTKSGACTSAESALLSPFLLISFNCLCECWAVVYWLSSRCSALNVKTELASKRVFFEVAVFTIVDKNFRLCKQSAKHFHPFWSLFLKRSLWYARMIPDFICISTFGLCLKNADLLFVVSAVKLGRDKNALTSFSNADQECGPLDIQMRCNDK